MITTKFIVQLAIQVNQSVTNVIFCAFYIFFVFANLINMFGRYTNTTMFYETICIDSIQYQHIFFVHPRKKDKKTSKLEHVDLLGILFQRYHYYDVHAKVK